jgi:hypothetical protein
MKNHVLRPLWVVLAGIALLLVVRHFVVPSDFGVEEGGNFTYNFHRQSNLDEWKNFKVKYRGREYCQECHEENTESILNSAGPNVCVAIPIFPTQPVNAPIYLVLIRMNTTRIQNASNVTILITLIWRICNELFSSRFIKKYF